LCSDGAHTWARIKPPRYGAPFGHRARRLRTPAPLSAPSAALLLLMLITHHVQDDEQQAEITAARRRARAPSPRRGTRCPTACARRRAPAGPPRGGDGAKAPPATACCSTASRAETRLRGACCGRVMRAPAKFFARFLLSIHAKVHRHRRHLSRLVLLPGVVLLLQATPAQCCRRHGSTQTRDRRGRSACNADVWVVLKDAVPSNTAWRSVRN
jgi:hypothetical protein